MIGHQDVGQQAHGRAFPGLPQDFLEGGIVGSRVKQRGTSHRSIEDVVDVTRINTRKRRGISLV